MSRKDPPGKRSPHLQEPPLLTPTQAGAPPPLPAELAASGSAAPTLPEEERLFVERLFAGVRSRREEILARAALASKRSSTPPSLLSSPEQRLLTLREELFARDAQLLRLSEIWNALRRKLSAEREGRQRAQEELQPLREQLLRLQRHVAALESNLAHQQREYGKSVDGLLTERLSQEKELIEIVADKEREANLLKRELKERDREIESLEEEIARLREEGAKKRRIDALRDRQG